MNSARIYSFLIGLAIGIAGVAIGITLNSKPDPKKWDIEIRQFDKSWYTNTFENHGNCAEFFDYKGRHVLVCGDWSAAGRTEPKSEVKTEQS